MDVDIFKKDLIAGISASTSSDRRLLVNKIIEENIPISELLDILFLDHPVSTRFSWLLGDLSARKPDLAPEILRFCYSNMNDIKVKDIIRVVAKQCHLCGPDLPAEIEGELVDKLFEWLADPQSSISIKNFAMFSLAQACQKYPELKSEFIIVVKDQMDLISNSFKNRASKILRGL